MLIKGEVRIYSITQLNLISDNCGLNSAWQHAQHRSERYQVEKTAMLWEQHAIRWWN